MKVALAQLNSRVGDFAGNRARIRAAVEYADVSGAELVVLPELATVGYPPRDLLFDRDFVRSARRAMVELALDLRGAPPVVAGGVAVARPRPPGQSGLFNVAAVLHEGRVAFMQPKRLLPTYDVFLESRWFQRGRSSRVVEIAGRRVGLMICEDMWDEAYRAHPGRDLVEAGAELLVCISASPYRPGVFERRLTAARRQAAPIVFVNLVGANDEIIFDGQGFALDGDGRLVARLAAFDEVIQIVDVPGAAPIEEAQAMPVEEELFRALVLGVRDFVGKNGLKHAFLGLSGGVDSALVACIAAEALGPDRVTGVAMPSRHSDPRSTESARELAASLGITFEVVPIEPLHLAAEASLAHVMDGGSNVDENLQARLRALVLLAYVNRRGGVLLNTSNKTELTLGYGTLHGDMAGTLGVVADLTKPQIYALARWYDAERRVIPRFILDRPPSAELAPDQVDPFDYGAVAPTLESLVQGEITERDARLEARLLAMYRAAEHKRRQFGIGLKVSDRAFGSGRLVPVTRR